MKAFICPKYGGPEVLQLKEIDKPIIKQNEVLIKIEATTVNRTDCATMRAKPFLSRLITGLFNPKKPILGTEFAGIVEQVGHQVKNYNIGDRVFGFNEEGFSTYAEFIALPDDATMAIIPNSNNFDQMASSFEGAHYAYNFINKIDLQKGDKVLVNGATGGIGSAALQLLKYYGATVTATCEGKYAELVKSLGAVEVIDYIQTDFTKHGHKYKYIFDTVGKSSFGKCKAILEDKGIYISSELGKGAQNIYLALFTPMFNTKKVVFPIPVKRMESINLIVDLIKKGDYSSVIDRCYTFDQIPEAIKYVEQGQKIGNVVITY